MAGLTALKTNRGVTPLADRVASLEERMTAVEGAAGTAADAATAAAAAASRAADAVEALSGRVGEVLNIVEGAKSVGGFVRKHYPRLIAFGTGICAAAGYGNPKVLQFISHFFGI